MIVLSHRGYWTNEQEKNKTVAFIRSFELAFGTETDIRDYKGELIISHNIADDNCISVRNFFEVYNQYDTSLPLALNILPPFITFAETISYFASDIPVATNRSHINLYNLY